VKRFRPVLLASVGLAALVGGSLAAPAFAQDGDGVCTVTVSLPATAEPGGTFTMSVIEDSDCAGMSGSESFSGGQLISYPDDRVVETGISFTHTPGTGDFSYPGIAPTEVGYYGIVLDGTEANAGYEIEASSEMETTWAGTTSTPTPTPVATPTPVVAPAPAKTATPSAKVPKGDVSALTLLNELKVKKEAHASTYKRADFKLWIDANHDGENTRAEVLKAESAKHKVKENSHHTVISGKWTSPYDGVKVTKASKLDIDHLVPLEEAWVSGAYKWTAKKREAYANDIGYAADLIAVTAHANRSKGDKEPNAYLPPKKSYDCTYVRNYIAVKARWGLTVNAGEKTALKKDLATYCTVYWVTKPPKPNVTRLVGTTKASGSSSSTSSSGTSSGGSSSTSSGSSSAPSGATAICRDGTYSYSAHRSGTCSHHGGVEEWL
jgi:Protein of unknown function (DUF3761)/Protein of unknown function (DUF1524)